MKTLFRLVDAPATQAQALAHFTAWFLDEDRPGFDWRRTAVDAQSIFTRGAYQGVAHCRRMLESAGITVTVVGLDEPGVLILTPTHQQSVEPAKRSPAAFGQTKPCSSSTSLRLKSP